jgi:hypothetical protein
MGSIQIYRDDEYTSNKCIEGMKKELADQVDMRSHRIEEFKPSYGFNPYEVAAVVIPGGKAALMVNGLKTVAQSIDQAVRHRASLLASCAGAIACATDCTILEPGTEDGEIQQSKKGRRFADLSWLDYNHMETYAPYYTPESLAQKLNDAQNATTVAVGWTPPGESQQRISQIFHNCGPCFSLENLPTANHHHYTVLGSYKIPGNVTLAEEPIAAVLYRPGNHFKENKFLFTGIHPELPSPLLATNSGTDLELGEANAIESQHNQWEADRKAMLSHWFRELGLHLH